LPRLVLDKKRAGSSQRWILAERVGAARIVSDIAQDVVRRAVGAVTRTPQTVGL
jgi:3-dehydroquinate synthetase